MQEKRKINFEELRPMIETGHKWRFRRFLKSAFGVFGAYGSGAFVASGISAIAVAGGVAAGVAVGTVMPAVIIPVGLLAVGITVFNQYKTRQAQKGKWEKIFGTANALGKFQKELKYFVEEGLWINGFDEMFENFEGEDIEEKLRNIFGDDYDDLKKHDFIKHYKSAKDKEEEQEEREVVLSHFFDDNDRELDLENESDQNLAECLQNQVKKLTPEQYERLAPKINFFQDKNQTLQLQAGLSLKQTTYNSERTVKKGWKYYLEHGGKTVLTAFMGAAAGFGFVAGIGVLAGVGAVSASGVGLGVLIGAIVVAVVIAVVAVAVKAYVDDKEEDIVDALTDGSEACSTFAYELSQEKDNIKDQKDIYKINKEDKDEFRILKSAIKPENLPKDNEESAQVVDEPKLKQESKRFIFENFISFFNRKPRPEAEENQRLSPEKKKR